MNNSECQTIGLNFIDKDISLAFSVDNRVPNKKQGIQKKPNYSYEMYSLFHRKGDCNIERSGFIKLFISLFQTKYMHDD